MNINQAFQSKYFKADDLAEGELRPLTIERFVMENVAPDNKPKDTKPVLYFSNAEQGLVLNQTRAAVIVGAYGEETDYWVGQPIWIKRGKTTYAGKITPCIDVTVQPQQQRQSRPIAGPAPHVATQGLVRQQGAYATDPKRQGRPVPPPQEQYEGPEEEEVPF